MIISFRGYGHLIQGISKFEYAIESENMVLILKGCHSDIESKSFMRLFSERVGFNKVENFEENVKYTADQVLNKVQEDFSIIALFELENRYVVKFLGNTFIITKNANGLISYLRYYYGDSQPYMVQENHNFETVVLDKQKFQQVYVATPGILPIVKNKIAGFDELFNENKSRIETIIKENRQIFYDDVTIGRIGA